MPYAPKSLYTPRYADSIAQLLTRQGDIRAAGAARSGEIWGNAIGNLGQIAGQAVQGYAQQKEQEKQQKSAEQRQAMFEEAVGAFDPTKPMDTYRKLAVAVGPQAALEFTKGVVSLQNLQKPEATFEDFKQATEALWRTKQIFGPEYLAQKWPELAPALQAGAKKFLPGADVSQPTPEILAGLDQLHEEFNPKKAGEPKVVGGALVTPEGKELYRAPVAPEQTLAEKTTEAQAMSAARARGTASVKPAGGGESKFSPVAEAVALDWEAGIAQPTTGELRAQASAYIRSQGRTPPRQLSVGQQDRVMAVNTTVDTLDEIEAAYEKVKSKVGPIKYQFAELKQKLPWTASDPDFTEFQRLLTGMSNIEIKNITGAQMSEQEAERLLTGMARGTLKPGDFEAALKVMRRNAQRTRENIWWGPKGKPSEQAGASSDEGWTELSGGIRIREKK